MKKIQKGAFWISVALIIFMITAVKPLCSLDEVWNFNIARCISNGLVPYRDISMVSTPLLGWIMAIFLKIFGQEMYVTRLFSIALFFLVIFITSKVLKKIEIREDLSYIIATAILCALLNFLNISYNVLGLLFILLIIYLELRTTEEAQFSSKIRNIIIGAIAGLVVCTKQSLGLFACIVCAIIPLFRINCKDDMKNALFSVLFRCIGIAIPVLIFIIYLLINGAFLQFLDYSVLGVRTFSNKIAYGELIKSRYLYIAILSITVPVIIADSVIISSVMTFKKKKDMKLIILLLYSLVMYSVVFPIADNEHFVIGIVPSLLLAVYILKLGIDKFKILQGKKTDKFARICSIILILSLTLWVEIQNAEKLGTLSKYRSINHFKYISIDQGTKALIEDVGKYIDNAEKKVYVLDSAAAVIMVPKDRYNKDYDMFCLGNLGAGGEAAQIEKIKNEDALYLIIDKRYSMNWQTPKAVIRYVRDNMSLVGSVNRYEVYENIKNDVEE